jgi:PBP1b-binding outer membrane lipoprotein LpoB
MNKLSNIMKKGTIILFLTAVFLLSGCGINSGLVNQYSVNGANTNVILQKKNFKVIGTVSGESSDHYVFFIGGRKQNLIAKAKQNMIDSAKLDGTSKAIIICTHFLNK